MDLGRKIKQLRLANDLTLEALANRSELSKGFTISYQMLRKMRWNLFLLN